MTTQTKAYQPQPNPPFVEVRYRLQPETTRTLDQVPAGTVSAQSVRRGVDMGEPLVVIADALLRYAKAYNRRFDGKVGQDGVGGEAFRDMLRGVKVFLDFDGGAALAANITTDTKDNACMCGILEAACAAAGIDWNDL